MFTEISPNLVPNGSIDNDCRLPGAIPSSEQWWPGLLTHICLTRSRWITKDDNSYAIIIPFYKYFFPYRWTARTPQISSWVMTTHCRLYSNISQILLLYKTWRYSNKVDYEIIGGYVTGVLKMPQCGFMEHGLKYIDFFCSKTYNTLHSCHNFPGGSQQAARGARICEKTIFVHWNNGCIRAYLNRAFTLIISLHKLPAVYCHWTVLMITLQYILKVFAKVY